MVRHRMRSRRGGTRGGRTRPQAAQSSVLASPPHSHENSPPPRSPPRYYPHMCSGWGQGQASMAAHSDIRLHTAISPLHSSSVPHSTQFRVQSSLNRLIITANVTIVFSEENEQNSAQARNSEAPSQGERNQGAVRGFENARRMIAGALVMAICMVKLFKLVTFSMMVATLQELQ